jgi:hypothetical protein
VIHRWHGLIVSVVDAPHDWHGLIASIVGAPHDWHRGVLCVVGACDVLWPRFEPVKHTSICDDYAEN